MQPLISPVDHESRQNSYNRDDNDHEERTEDTPLLHRFPGNSAGIRTSPQTSVVVTFLLIFFIAGVIIGIYLLLVQSNSENILPPVDTPLRIVGLSQWDIGGRLASKLKTFTMANRVIVVQTDSETCHSTDHCVKLLQSMEAKQYLPYNFLVSSNGEIFEALGWGRHSQKYTVQDLVLAFIGNFTEVSPSYAQIQEASKFFAESISRRHLAPMFVISPGKSRYTPTYLYKSMTRFPQWDPRLSEST